MEPIAQYIESRPFAALKVGDKASLTRVISRRDAVLLAHTSASVLHSKDDGSVRLSESVSQLVEPSVWAAPLIYSLIHTQLPGPGSECLTESLSFLKSVALESSVTITALLTQKDAHNQQILLTLQCMDEGGNVLVEGEAWVRPPKEAVRQALHPLPSVTMVATPESCTEKLVRMRDGLKPLRTAVVHPCDTYSLLGAVTSADQRLIEPVLVGPKDKILAVAKQENVDISRFELVHTPHSHAAAERAVELAHQGEVEALMKGKLHTDELMAAVVDKEKGLRTARRMSHVFIFDLPNYHKPLFLTDAALNIQPDLMSKKDIVQNAIDLFDILGFGTPKVAILSAVETVTMDIPSTLDATALCKMAERGQIMGGILDGPLAFDNAVSVEAAAIKGIHSPVAGDADILVVPDIESGNMLYKQARFLTGNDGAGIVLGARVPVILTSRAGNTEARNASSALALVYFRNRESRGIKV